MDLLPPPRLGRDEDEDDNNPDFWLEFQTASDGLHGPGSTNAPGAPTAFPRFPDLPPELRLRVWELLLQPRVVIAACLSTATEAAKREQLARRRRAPSPTPALLHACAESRALGLRHYELAFAWQTPRMLASSGRRRHHHSHPDGAAPPPPPRRTQQQARVWFNYALDALMLLGDLEPFDSYGFNTPMVYFLRREDTRRVRHVACAFEELGYGELEADQIFACLFHVVDRFPGAGRLLITSTDADLARFRAVLSAEADNNIMQKIWRGWVSGTSVVTSSLADKQILMVREDELERFIREDC